ncbi:predicted protein [Histoplasma capsulatum var. duboisii H88]|uniref:Predicted protein n=2 Tax=Ajellomyces capsulatus TaxID=5037 RepID=F0U6U2_AJEC8|nr:predicted protein [Histoplasma capsulatum H143]EGC41521.1 predicted protein [Histoplasma capsulatum var. duboisii H88]
MPQGTRTQTTYVYGGKAAFSYGILVPPLNLLSATRRHCSISLAMGRLPVVLGISEPPVTRHIGPQYGVEVSSIDDGVFLPTYFQSASVESGGEPKALRLFVFVAYLQQLPQILIEPPPLMV